LVLNMPKLEILRETKKVKLNCVKEGEVEVYTSITGVEIEEMQKLGVFERQGQNVLAPIKFLIKDWNLTDDKGNKLPVEMEHIKKLDFKDLMMIYKEAGFDSGNPDFLGRKTSPAETG